ncbi:MAG: nucleotidyltransferase domain-containing protein [Bacteroidales bacterium]|nr:nucleotidyltransferase domain-containing protein [Bacteroidales bacterium]
MSELLNMTATTFIENIKDKIHSVDKSAQVYLYGSRARQTARDDSDWDLLILVDKDKVSIADEQRFRHELVDLEVKYDQAISTLVYPSSEWNTKYAVTPLYTNISKEGILL